MKPPLLTDENIAVSTVKLLRQSGYNVKDIKEEKLQGISDDLVIRLARKEKRAIITLDKDFANVLNYPPLLNFGIIIIDLRFPKPEFVNKILYEFLKDKTQSKLNRKLFLIDEIGVRIRG